MSGISSLEMFNLSAILQGLESHAKTGLLVIRQGEQRVELYFRRGQLMCIGPVRANVTLGDRLLQAGVISQQAHQQAIQAMGEAEPSETRMALTLIDLGYLNHENLYDWAAKESSTILQTLLTWKTGEISFEDDVQPPLDRLLIAISVGSLLPPSIATPPQSVAVGNAAATAQKPASDEAFIFSDAPTLCIPSQFAAEPTSGPLKVSSLFSSEFPVFQSNSTSGPLPSTLLPPPKKVTTPLPARHIDTSFMQPHMVLIPTDLSVVRQQNPELQLTPEQWRLLTRADGRTPLQMACQALAMTSDMVCRVAGELIALGLVTISSSGVVNESSPVSRNSLNSGVGNDPVKPDYVTNSVELRAALMPTPEKVNFFASPAPIETESQWGNGGNGATFVLGGGWILASQPSEPRQTSGPVRATGRAYAHVESSR